MEIMAICLFLSWRWRVGSTIVSVPSSAYVFSTWFFSCFKYSSFSMMVRFKWQNKKNKGDKAGWWGSLYTCHTLPKSKFGSPAEDSNIGHVPLLSVVLPNLDKQLVWTNQLKFCVLILHEGKAGLKCMIDWNNGYLSRAVLETNRVVILYNKEIAGFIVISKSFL